MKRLLALLLIVQPAIGFAQHTKDVDFLLHEFETKAGALLKQKGIDWQSVSADFKAAAARVTSDQELYALVLRLIGQLHDGHASIVQSQIKPTDESKERRYTGPRVHLVLNGDQVLVRAAFKDAAEAGIKAGHEVLKIDGKPARSWLDQRILFMQDRGSSYSTPNQALYAACHWGLGDWEGTPITFELKDESGTIKSVKRVRNGGPNQVPFGPIFPPPNLKSVGRQSYGKTPVGLAYIHLRDVPSDLPMQFDLMLKEIGDATGLILDMRANGGGCCDHTAVFGRFIEKGKQWGQYEGLSDHPFIKPVVVIVDSGVRSAGETVAGMFKEAGRAYMIGDGPTAGTSSQKTEITTPSGLIRVRFSVATNMSRYNHGRGIEGIGIAPHELVPVSSEGLLKNEDSLIQRAVELLQKGFPEDIVDYPGH